MRFEPTAIRDVVLILPQRIADDRGYFAETFRRNLFEQEIGKWSFNQDNESLSKEQGTVRGLHFQRRPHGQGKLVRCVAGAILDVAVDIRPNSRTFGQHVAVELSEANGHQLWVPPGFAHGFCTLVPDTRVVYKVTQYYSAAHEGGVRWDDPKLGISWPVSADEAVLSAKDKVRPFFDDLVGELMEDEASG